VTIRGIMGTSEEASAGGASLGGTYSLGGNFFLLKALVVIWKPRWHSYEPWWYFGSLGGTLRSLGGCLGGTLMSLGGCLGDTLMSLGGL
jgi:hypothetical protein